MTNRYRIELRNSVNDVMDVKYADYEEGINAAIHRLLNDNVIMPDDKIVILDDSAD